MVLLGREMFFPLSIVRRIKSRESQVLKRKAPLDQVKYWLKGEDAKKTKAHAVRAGENIWMVA